MEYKKERRVAEFLALIVTVVWFFFEQSWQSGVSSLIALIFLSFDFLFDRKKSDLTNAANENAFKADKELYIRLINTLPHDHQMEEWLKDQPMGQRGLIFDYYDRVFRFADIYGRETEFFHDDALNTLLKDLIYKIKIFRRNTAQYMSPSEMRENRFEVKRHHDYREYDPSLDAQENRRMEELDDNATEVYNSLIVLYVECKKTFKV